MSKIFVTIPTYNERDNIFQLVNEILRLPGEIEIVVADDDSPDGTWQVVLGLTQREPRVHLLRRTEDKGRGRAGVDAFRYALDHDAEVIFEMDGDLSHHPRYIPLLLKEVRFHDLVIGSRIVSGGVDARSSRLRKAVTQTANAYARWLLGVPVRDCNSGFRCFRREVLEGIDLDSIVSKGPSIVHEILYKAHQRGFSMKEVPIHFEDRQAGQSNLNLKKLLFSAWMVLKLRGSAGWIPMKPGQTRRASETTEAR
ncbi:MAG: polyprenol monophosphomannose synthase [Nitrospinae bacterium]|nr:polyprenol monophosphomannose synthase [Nitrospinota bacterium]